MAFRIVPTYSAAVSTIAVGAEGHPNSDRTRPQLDFKSGGAGLSLTPANSAGSF